jgi:hypothetical protein
MLTKARAVEIVRDAGARKTIARSDHFRRALRRHGFSILDADRVVRTGTIEREPRWNDEHRNYEVRVRGRSYDDRDVRVVLGVTEPGSVVCVTIVHITRGKRR